MPEAVWKSTSMIHASADWKGQGSFFFVVFFLHCINDCGVTLEKEGHRRLL